MCFNYFFYLSKYLSQIIAKTKFRFKFYSKSGLQKWPAYDWLAVAYLKLFVYNF